MENDLLNLLYKIQSEENLSEENRELLVQAIEQIKSVHSSSQFKEIAKLLMRLFLQYFDPDKWDFFNN